MLGGSQWLIPGACQHAVQQKPSLFAEPRILFFEKQDVARAKETAKGFQRPFQR